MKANISHLSNFKTQHIKILYYSQLDNYIRQGYFFYKDDLDRLVLVTSGPVLLEQLIDINYNVQIQLITRKDFYQLLEQNFAHLNMIKAKYFLTLNTKQIIAKNINYTKALSVFFIIFFLILFYFPLTFHLINITCYFIENIFKTILFIRAVITETYPYISYYKNSYWYDTLPIYTILIPMYKEAQKLSSILHNVDNLIYPKEKLDVKIIIEQDDYSMVQTITSNLLPTYVHIVQVPPDHLRTKPKALNYAIQYCRGKYIVIYDAEDKPDCDQLLKSVYLFENLPDEYACLQAKLNFYNANENLITRFFSLEYSLWFEHILKGLSLFNLPVPLGGTSNHLKYEILHKVGFWDAYNVTEDAELGIRLYSFGYKVCMIDSYTMEEAPIDLINWLSQRARWIKGFIQTFLVFLAQNNKSSKFKFYQIIAIAILVGFSPYGFLGLPFIMLTIKVNTIKIIDYIWLANAFFATSYLYGCGLTILIKNRNLTILGSFSLILWPLYFILHTIASYQSILELLTSPFKWNKTKHGISKYE